MPQTTAEIIEYRFQHLQKVHDPLELLAFILDAFGFPKATFERIRLQRAPEGFVYAPVTNKILFASDPSKDLSEVLQCAQNIKRRGQSYRFYICTDGELLVAKDSAYDIFLKCSVSDLKQNCTFFLPLVGIEPSEETSLQSLDEKISSTFATLANQLVLRGSRRSYLSFLNRLLLLCLLTGIDDDFGQRVRIVFTASCPQDGSDDRRVFQLLFSVLFSQDCEETIPSYLSSFDYVVNEDPLEEREYPTFDSDSHETLVHLLSYRWSDVTHDIVGAVVQAIAPDETGKLTFNYTSALYVTYLTSPMMLRGWHKRFVEGYDNFELLHSLLDEVTQTTLFDPSCEIGSILCMAYSDVKAFEQKIVDRLNDLQQEEKYCCSFSFSNIVGLEKDRVRARFAAINLALAEKKMRKECSLADFGMLVSEAQSMITIGDPVLSDWELVCFNDGHVCILTNPEYRGARRMTEEQKRNLDRTFNHRLGTGNLDYCTCWIEKASNYIKGTPSKTAFFTTNSIVQGDQVSALWPGVFEKNVCISFAHTAFKWKTAARNTNAVTVVAIGLESTETASTFLLDNGSHSVEVPHIGPYLTKQNTIVKPQTRPLASDFPQMPKGDMPYEHNYLLFDAAERDDFIQQYPQAAQYMKRIIGGDEFMNDIERWCIWTPTRAIADTAALIPGIKERYDKVREWRASSSASQALKREPWRFRETLETRSYSFVVPNLSSENYIYIPMGFIDSSTIATNLVFIVYDCDIWLFGILSSRIHNLWARAVGGGYETRIRYSNQLVYNTFPLPELSEEQKHNVERCALMVLAERERYYERPLSQLYKNLPESLAAAHRTLDLVVDGIFSDEPFTSDEERLDALFERYEAMTNEDS